LADQAEPGAWRLEISFEGVLNDDLRGFYRSVYTDGDGNEKTIATTQFEATDARRAFPCWDEPDFKATYGVTLVVDESLTAISNAPEVARESAGSGKVAITFKDTMKMSTYLVAFIVGELEVTDPVDVDGIPLRIAHVPGKGHLTDYALEAGAFALRFYADYYDIPYPGDKMDMIAIPDFAWGAMENLGAVTYRETALLLDRERATQAELMRIAEVIAHEIAHMWFGDLVTMKWWNGIWLNEAFATFASMKCVDAFRPDWETWLTFAADRTYSMGTDATESTRPIEFPVESPEEASEMFDNLTYLKGSSVLRMLEQYLGEDTFRKGVSNYLKHHAHANTETADLWAALDAASGVPVGEMMDTWIFQGGFPRLTVAGSPGSYTLTQEHFRFDEPGDHRWQVPVILRSDTGEQRVLMSEQSVTFDAGDGLVVNAGGNGFYRVQYSPELRDSVRGRLDTLEAAERYNLVSDLWADVLKGGSEAGEFLALVGRLGDEREVDVWEATLAGLGELDRVVSSDIRPDLQQFSSNLVSGKANEMGWEPAAGEDDRTRKLRGLLIRARGNLANDQPTQEAARLMLNEVRENPAGVDSEIADAALFVTAANGDIDDFDRFIDISNTSQNPQEIVKNLRAAATVPGSDAAKRLFDLVLDGDVRSQDAFWVLAVMLGDRENGPYVWELMKERWDEMMEALPPTTGRRILDRIPFRSEPDVAADIEAWLADHHIQGGDMYGPQQIELMKVRVGLRQREQDRLGEALNP
ncbi:MAG: M1 family aminopeptidase, partial [Actinobacteria bacterium]|nr:M1 family aminopeptidase [Actinomycetota bacterium]